MKKAVLVVLLIIVGGIAVAVPVVLLNKLRAANRNLSISERNIAAMRDTVRRYETESSSAVALMAFQDSVNTDSLINLGGALGEALRRERQTARTLTQTRIEMEELRQTVQSQAVALGDVPLIQVDSVTGDTTFVESAVDRTASFDIEGPPIEGTVEVMAPADTVRPWVFQPALRVTPFDMTYVIGCDEQRSAIVNVEGPPWATISMTQGTVSEDVCHPFDPVGFGSFKITAGGFAVGAGVGALAVLLINLIR